MTMMRFDFQRQAIRESEGVVLNVGANTDPGNFFRVFGERIENVDFIDFDEVLQEPIEAKHYFDATQDWPLEDDHAELVVIGDTLEHVDEVGALSMLQEAFRCGRKLCITVPNDSRLGPGWNQDGSRLPEEERIDAPGSYHVQQVTEEKLRSWLTDAGWQVDEWHEVPYGFSQSGYFVRASRPA